jgi:hypothetical protein
MNLLLLCILTLCSNDMLGVLNDETIQFDASEGATTYDVYADGVLCLSIIAPNTSILLPPSCRGDAVTVRACNEFGCSSDSDPIEVLPFACLRTTSCTQGTPGDARTAFCESCEYPCFDGAPKRLSNVPLCY